MTDVPRGRFVWYELMTPEPEAAQEFYTKVVGWGTTVFTDLGDPYTMFTRGEVPVGGIRPTGDGRTPAMHPHWLAYITTPDVDATTARATELGGEVLVPPTDIPTVGRFSVVQDPHGAAFAPFRPEGDSPEEMPAPEIGDASWHELTAGPAEESLSFYSDLFGWKATDSMDMGEMGTYQMYGHEGTTLGGMMKRPADSPAPPSWLHYVRVDDVDEAAGRITAHGGKIVVPPMEVPGGDRIVVGTDPQGAAFALHALKKA